ncbi:MAG: hypothetical protein GXO79_05825 [Chlorobi bacterium]|nr:hypothetical protein [Chlorobiota bacterium]
MISNIFKLKRKKALSILIRIFSVFYIVLLSGCLNYIQDVNIYPDGSGKMSLHYWSNLPYDINSDELKNLTFFSPDFLKKEFSSKYYNLEGIRVYTDSTDGTTHAIINITFNNIDSLNYSRTFQGSEFSLIDDGTGVKIFTQKIPSIKNGLASDSNKYNITYKYTFYGKIYDDNSTERNGRTLTWKFKPNEIGPGKTIYVKYKPFKLRETPEWIYILMGIVIIIVMFYLLRKSN